MDLWNAQVAAHAACNGDHMCLVDVWVNETAITGVLEDLVRDVGVRLFCSSFAHTTYIRYSRQLLARHFNQTEQSKIQPCRLLLVLDHVIH